MSGPGFRFNPPPGWPAPPDGWVPPKGWAPDPSWPEPPPGWQLWLPVEGDGELPEETQPAKTPNSQSATDDEDLALAQRRIAVLESEITALRSALNEGSDPSAERIVLDDDAVLQEVGIYRYHHPLENAAAYKDRLTALSTKIAEATKSGHAIEKSNLFTFDNSLAKGRKMTRDLSKLMLRAYNAEVDNSIRSLRAGSVITAKKRVEATRTAIARLGKLMEMRISDEFHELRIQELELTADFLMKKQEEREAAREERARIREEQRVQKELAAERERLDKEKEHISRALRALQEGGSADPDLEKRLAEIDEAIEQNDFRAANIRAGYVYVISNRGAFGSDVVKIGLTRRLDPVERVQELSGAAVPFRFDVHCLFFSEDAVTLETELHQHFTEKRLNLANNRKEFFFASPAEVREVLVSKVGNLLEFRDHADATEYFQSVGSWPRNL